MKTHIIGYDIGGTKCAVVLADASSGITIINRAQFNTPAGYPAARDLLFKHTYDLLAHHGLTPTDIKAVGISSGGPLDSVKGIIHSPPNLPGWDDIPICHDITQELGIPAYLQNDANACALVEWKLGAGRGTKNMIFITMGTGFGAGIIAEGVLINGASGMAGEVGHIRLKDDGPVGYGKEGSVEGFCSGAGITMQASAFTLDKIHEGASIKWLDDCITIHTISPEVMAKYAYAGDALAIQFFNEIGENLGSTLAMLIDMLNPERIVIGSIFVRCEKLLRPSMQRVIDMEALGRSRNACEILPAETGEELGDLASILTACYNMGY